VTISTAALQPPGKGAVVEVMTPTVGSCRLSVSASRRDVLSLAIHSATDATATFLTGVWRPALNARHAPEMFHQK
jgi:hypothetical protein